MPDEITGSMPHDWRLEEDVIEFLDSKASNPPQGGFLHFDADREPRADYCTVKAVLVELEPGGQNHASRIAEITTTYRAGEEIDAQTFTLRRGEIGHSLMDIAKSDLSKAGSHDSTTPDFINDTREFDEDVREWTRVFRVTSAEVDPTTTSV